MLNTYISIFKKYTVFDGRAGRREYWIFMLTNIVLYFFIEFVCNVIALSTEIMWITDLSYLFVLVILLPSLAVQVRRLHDTNRSGWWILIGLVPLFGVVVLLVFGLLDGESKNNTHDSLITQNGITGINSVTPLNSVVPIQKTGSPLSKITAITFSVIAFIASGVHILFALVFIVFCDSGPVSRCLKFSSVAMLFCLTEVSVAITALVMVNKKTKLALLLSLLSMIIALGSLALLN